ALPAILDDAAIHRREHPAFRGLVSAPAGWRLPRDAPGRQPAHRLHAARGIGPGPVPGARCHTLGGLRTGHFRRDTGLTRGVFDAVAKACAGRYSTFYFPGSHAAAPRAASPGGTAFHER